MHKRPNKEEYLAAKVGKLFTTPEGREYSFDYRKDGRKYTFILIYKGQRCQVRESEYNTIPTDTILKSIEDSILKFN